jgi:hypothetical protein
VDWSGHAEDFGGVDVSPQIVAEIVGVDASVIVTRGIQNVLGFV